MPHKVKKIIHILFEAGYEAYIVGGCVRDSILGKKPKDWDIATSAKPEQVKALFKRTVDTGIKHGTVTVLFGKEGFEVTTFRIDGEYEDNRHPKNVVFTSSLEEDLKRRDFTMNAMAYNDKTGLIDIFGGQKDMKNCLIRCVGDAVQRFKEDALRMMRAVRFSGQFGYEIQKDTKKAIGQYAGDLNKISMERIATELQKLLLSPHPEKIEDAYRMGMTKVFLPEFDAMMDIRQSHPYHFYTVGEYTIKSLCHVPNNKIERLSMLFHDIGMPLSKTTDKEGIVHFHNHEELGEKITYHVMRRLRYDNETIHKVSRLVRWHNYCPGLIKKEVRKGIYKIGEDIFPFLFSIKRGDILAKEQSVQKEKLLYVDKLQEIYEEIISNKDCISRKTLAISGRDLIEAGVPEGKEMGNILEKLLNHVLENPQLNEKEKLLNILSTLRT